MLQQWLELVKSSLVTIWLPHLLLLLLLRRHAATAAGVILNFCCCYTEIYVVVATADVVVVRKPISLCIYGTVHAPWELSLYGMLHTFHPWFLLLLFLLLFMRNFSSFCNLAHLKINL